MTGPGPGPAGGGSAELDELDGALRGLAAEPVPAPGALRRRVMERVEALAVHDRFAVLAGPGGVTAVAVGVVSVVAGRAVRAVPGVAGAEVRVVPAEDAPGPDVVLEVGLVARAGVPLPALAARVRRTVVAGVAAQTGLRPVRVDVEVRDLQV